MIITKNPGYVFNGLFDYNQKSLEGLSESSLIPAAIEFNGSFTPDKIGFFRGTYNNTNIEEDQYSIINFKEKPYTVIGHLHKNKNVFTHLIFVLTPLDSIDQHCIYSMFNNSHSKKDETLEGFYVGGWYLSFDKLNPKLFRDYASFRKLADGAGSIEGYAELELKLNVGNGDKNDGK